MPATRRARKPVTKKVGTDEPQIRLDIKTEGPAHTVGEAQKEMYDAIAMFFRELAKVVNTAGVELDRQIRELKEES
jgi:hypothetical protein